MRAQGVGLAHIGKSRKSNEDCWLADDQLALYAVADGMGGHKAGEVASATALEAAAATVRAGREVIEAVLAGKKKPRVLGELLEDAVQAANKAVFELAKADVQRQGMGCTLTLLLVVGNRAFMGHVGDSRLYVCRQGVIHQLSQDHTFADELVRSGVIPPERARKHKLAHVLTRAVGTKEALLVDLLRVDLMPADRLLLCSDGLSNYLEDDAWLARELAEEDLEGIPEELVRFANESGGSDNITALVVAIEEEPSAEELARAEEAQVRLAALETSFLCGGLSLARKSRVLAHCQGSTVEAGAVLVKEGQPLSSLILLVEGGLVVEQDGRTVAEIHPGSHLGTTTLLSERPACAAVRASEESSVLTLTQEAFRRLTRRRPRLGLLLLRRLAIRLGSDLDACSKDGAHHLLP